MIKQGLISTSDEIANKFTTNILLFTTIAFPILIFLGWIDVFPFDIVKLCIYCLIGTVGSVSPFILRKLGVNQSFLKYYVIVMSGVTVGALNLNYQVGIYMTLILPMAISCIYFDKKLTLVAAGVQIVITIVTNYPRITSNPLYSDDPIGNYIAISAGQLIEAFILSVIFIRIAKRTRSILNRLSSSEKQSQKYINQLQDIMHRSKNASETLSTSVKQLLQSIEQTTLSTANINHNADNASIGCEQNLRYIENTNTTVANISDTLESISAKTQKLSEISQDTTAATEENEKIN